jgi:hypothetical protein
MMMIIIIIIIFMIMLLFIIIIIIISLKIYKEYKNIIKNKCLERLDETRNII